MAQMRRQFSSNSMLRSANNRGHPAARPKFWRIERCGLCHSDLHIQDGYADLGNGALDTTRGMTLPSSPSVTKSRALSMKLAPMRTSR